jgi:histidinol-phosphate aminotransferase
MDPTLQRPDWTKSGARDPRLLWLDKNENTDPTLAAITARVLGEIDPRSVAVYPDCAPLYLALAQHVGVSPKSLILAQGSDGVIGSVFRAFIAPGDVVVHTAPTYQMYPVYSKMMGATAIPIQYRPSAGDPFISPDEIIDTVKQRRPKLVCLPNPDSPTGTILDSDAMRRVIQGALDVGALALVDEAYHPFYRESVIPLIDEFPNVIVARTFSKAWGLTGLRLGYGVASPEVAILLHKVRPNYEVSEVSVVMAVRMITEFEKEMLASVARLTEGRDAFDRAMKELGMRTIRGHASFSHVAFGDLAPRIHHALSDVVLYRRDFSEPCLAGFSRFSSTTRSLFQPVIERIRQTVTSA